MDQFVDEYFFFVYKIEDWLNEIEESWIYKMYGILMNEVFDFRIDFLYLRWIIILMCDLFYWILSFDNVKEQWEMKVYFSDIYDYLLKLFEIVEFNCDMMFDLCDSYVILNLNWMNVIMMILMIVLIIFILFIFIVGVYGMNFDNMLELYWKYGYFVVFGLMVVFVIGMLIWFLYKGWFKIFK